MFATLADVSEDRGWQLALGLIAAWRAAGDVRRASAVTRRLSDAAKGDGSKVEQAVLGLTALGNMFIEFCADCTGSPSTPSSGTPRRGQRAGIRGQRVVHYFTVNGLAEFYLTVQSALPSIQ